MRKRLLRYLRRKTLPPVARDEEAIHAAVDWEHSPQIADRETLLEMAKSQGHDAAAAYFFRWISEKSPAAHPPQVPVREVLIIPAALYEQYPEFNSDGAVLIEICGRLGIPARTLAVKPFGHIDENAAQIAEELRQTGGGVLVISLSKGATDFRWALQRFPDIDAKVSAWISVAGLFRGTFYLDRMIRSPSWRTRTWFRIVCWLHGSDIRSTSSLLAGEGSLLADVEWRRDLPFPVTSIVAVPLLNHLSTYLRLRCKALLKHGPNDGLTLFADGYFPGSRIIPVWGADHFFLVPGVSRVFSQAISEYLGSRR